MTKEAEILSTINSKTSAHKHHSKLVSCTHLDNDTLTKHGKTVGDSATLAVVPVINVKDWS